MKKPGKKLKPGDQNGTGGTDTEVNPKVWTD